MRFKRPGERWRPLVGFGAELPVGHRARHAPRQHPAHERADAAATSRPAASAAAWSGAPGPGARVAAWTCTCAAATSAPAGALARRAAAARAAPCSPAPPQRRVRRLWGSDSGGRFRTHGRHSHATVRGTRWLTEDRCDGTLTRVTEGAVVVRDLARRRRVLVRAGHSYLARKRAAARATGARP